MTQRPSGWYEDPEDPDQLRYWDGVLWSSRQMPKIKPGLDRSALGSASAVVQDQQARSRLGTSPPPAKAWQPDSVVAAGRRTTPDGEVLAGWWQRAGALIIDRLLTTLVGGLVALPWTLQWVRAYSDFFTRWGGVGPMPELPAEVINPPWQIFLATVIVYAVYEIGMTVWRGQTVGKIAAGIRVRGGTSAGSPDFGVSANRFVVKCLYVILSTVPLLGAIALMFTIVDYMWPVRDPASRALHDKVGGTYVVRTRGVTHLPR